LGNAAEGGSWSHETHAAGGRPHCTSRPRRSHRGGHHDHAPRVHDTASRARSPCTASTRMARSVTWSGSPPSSTAVSSRTRSARPHPNFHTHETVVLYRDCRLLGGPRRQTSLGVGGYGGVQTGKLPLKQAAGCQETIITGGFKQRCVLKDCQDLGMIQGQPRIERGDEHPVMNGAGMNSEGRGFHMLPFHTILGWIW
jgi:hypothetical protein